MVDEDVFRGDGRETIVVEFGDAFGDTDFEGFVEKIGPVAHDQLGDIGDGEQPIHDHNIVAARLQALDDQLPCAFRQRGAHFDPDDLAKLPLNERPPQHLLQVLAFLLKFDCAVSQGTEQAGVLYFEAGQKRVGKKRDDGFDGDKARDRAAVVVRGLRQANEAVEAVRHNDEGVH